MKIILLVVLVKADPGVEFLIFLPEINMNKFLTITLFYLTLYAQLEKMLKFNSTGSGKLWY